MRVISAPSYKLPPAVSPVVATLCMRFLSTEGPLSSIKEPAKGVIPAYFSKNISQKTKEKIKSTAGEYGCTVDFIKVRDKQSKILD